MFSKVKMKMLRNWLKYEGTTPVHPMLNEASNMQDLFDYYKEVLGGSPTEFFEDYKLGLQEFISNFPENEDYEDMDSCDQWWSDLFDAIEKKYSIELDCEDGQTREEIGFIFDEL